jgi:hypothetical protein
MNALIKCGNNLWKHRLNKALIYGCIDQLNGALIHVRIDAADVVVTL